MSERAAIVKDAGLELRGFNVSAMVIGYTRKGTPKVAEEYAVGSITSCIGEGSGTQRLVIGKSLEGSPITMDLKFGVGGLIMPTKKQIQAELRRQGYGK